MFMIFWYSNEFAKISLFRLKLWKNLQSLQGCKNTLRPHNDTCNTAFESLGVIVFNTTKSWYHSGTHGTKKCTYVKHIKLSRLERGHFEFFVFTQHVLTKTNIMKKSAFWSYFRKYLTSGRYFQSPTIFLQMTLY